MRLKQASSDDKWRNEKRFVLYNARSEGSRAILMLAYFFSFLLSLLPLSSPYEEGIRT